MWFYAKDFAEYVDPVGYHRAGVTMAPAHISKLSPTERLEDHCKNVCQAAMETAPMISYQIYLKSHRRFMKRNLM